MQQDYEKNEREIVREAAAAFAEGHPQPGPDGVLPTNSDQAIAEALQASRDRREEPSGHKGGAGTSQAEGRSGSEGAGRSGNAAARNTNR